MAANPTKTQKDPAHPQSSSGSGSMSSQQPSPSKPLSSNQQPVPRVTITRALDISGSSLYSSRNDNSNNHATQDLPATPSPVSAPATSPAAAPTSSDNDPQQQQQHQQQQPPYYYSNTLYATDPPPQQQQQTQSHQQQQQFPYSTPSRPPNDSSSQGGISLIQSFTAAAANALPSSVASLYASSPAAHMVPAQDPFAQQSISDTTATLMHAVANAKQVAAHHSMEQQVAIANYHKATFQVAAATNESNRTMAKTQLDHAIAQYQSAMNEAVSAANAAVQLEHAAVAAIAAAAALQRPRIPLQSIGTLAVIDSMGGDGHVSLTGKGAQAVTVDPSTTSSPVTPPAPVASRKSQTASDPSFHPSGPLPRQSSSDPPPSGSAVLSASPSTKTAAAAAGIDPSGSKTCDSGDPTESGQAASVSSVSFTVKPMHPYQAELLDRFIIEEGIEEEEGDGMNGGGGGVKEPSKEELSKKVVTLADLGPEHGRNILSEVPAVPASIFSMKKKVPVDSIIVICTWGGVFYMTDAQWKYQGGETHLIHIPNYCSFEDFIALIERMAHVPPTLASSSKSSHGEISGGGTDVTHHQMHVIRYKLPTDPSVWVDLINNEDISMMFDEYNQEIKGDIGVSSGSLEQRRNQEKLHLYIQWKHQEGTYNDSEGGDEGDDEDPLDEEKRKEEYHQHQSHQQQHQHQEQQHHKQQHQQYYSHHHQEQHQHHKQQQRQQQQQQHQEEQEHFFRRFQSSQSVNIPLTSVSQRMEIICPEEITLVKFLGSGGYGDVYLGRWHGCEAAVKCLNPALFYQGSSCGGDGGGGSSSETSSPKMNRAAVADLIREADMLASLRHPAVVWVYGLVLPLALREAAEQRSRSPSLSDAYSGISSSGASWGVRRSLFTQKSAPALMSSSSLGSGRHVKHLEGRKSKESEDEEEEEEEEKGASFLSAASRGSTISPPIQHGDISSESMDPSPKYSKRETEEEREEQEKEREEQEKEREEKEREKEEEDINVLDIIEKDLTSHPSRPNNLPGVVSIPALVTEYMAGGSLKSALMRNAGLIADPLTRVIIALDTAKGMEYLHSKRVIHFDLKSANLLLGIRDRRVVCKVSDFGLAQEKVSAYVSGVSSYRGTLPWTAPEVIKRPREVNEKVDVFGFGIVMWELWSSKEPYEGLNYHALMMQLADPAVRLRPAIPGSQEWIGLYGEEGVPDELAPGWKDLMEKCWDEDAEKRPDFTEIIKELRGMLLKMKNMGMVGGGAKKE